MIKNSVKIFLTEKRKWKLPISLYLNVNDNNFVPFLFLQISQRKGPLLPFPLVFLFRSLPWYLSCFSVSAFSVTNGKTYSFQTFFSNANNRTFFIWETITKHLLYKELFTFTDSSFFFFFLHLFNYFITLKFSILGCARKLKQCNDIKKVFNVYDFSLNLSNILELYWKFYHRCL